MLDICTVQCSAKNTSCVIMTALMQPVFKFWVAAYHIAHLIPVPKGQCSAGCNIYTINLNRNFLLWTLDWDNCAVCQSSAAMHRDSYHSYSCVSPIIQQHNDLKLNFLRILYE